MIARPDRARLTPARGGSAMKRMCAAGAMLLLFANAADAGAQQQPGTFELSVANIMRGPEHVGEPPSRVRWSDSGEWVDFCWKPGGRPWHEDAALYRVGARGGEPERLSGTARALPAPRRQSGDVSRGRGWRGVSST